MKIVIIGAGPAGLTAAYELLKRSSDNTVEIYECSDSIGGISRSAKYKDHIMDLGGHRFISKIHRVRKMWDEVLPVQGSPALDDKLLERKCPLCQGGPDPDICDDVMLRRTRISRIYYKNKFFDYPITEKIFGQLGFSYLFSTGLSYLHSCIFKRKNEDDLESFYINRFGKALYSMFFEGYTEKLWGRHPSEISSDWGTQRVKGLSVSAVARDIISKAFFRRQKNDRSLSAEFSYPKFGPGQFWERTTDRITEMGGHIHMNCTVVRLLSENRRITGITYEHDGKKTTVSADIVISSMPIKDLIAGMDFVPEEINRIASGLPYRDFITAGILADGLSIANTTEIKTMGNIIPDCWIYVQDTGVKMGRIQIYNNWSPYLLKSPQSSVWLGLEYFCNEGDEMWSMTDDAFVKMAVNELVKMGIISSADKVKDHHVEHVKKAYPAYSGTYSEMNKVIDYLDSFDNLYCIGRNGQHRYNNMDHSMMTAFEAADNILSGKATKENIWNVNTEKEYHEE